MKVVFPLVAAFLALPLATLEAPARAQPSESCGTKSGLCWPRLKRGQHGYQTKALQGLLTVRGVKVGADGIFGLSTQNAVRAYQKRKGLKVDGIAGFQTWESLVPSLGRGSRGSAVTTLQRLLNGKEYPLRNDGVYGASTEKAVRGLQQTIAITTVNGRATPTTWCYLVGGHIDGE